MKAFLTFLILVAGTVQAEDKIIIAHRGASGYLPEHTLEAYALAYGLGADYIEPDLVMTKDHELIALHDLYLEPTTDVEEQAPDRKRENGRWYAADFTLAEIKALHVHERLKDRFPSGKSDFEVPTFQEVIELVQGLNAATGRDVGIYPEIKDPSFHRENNLPLEQKTLAVLDQFGFKGPEAKCFVQCFDPETLKRLRDEHHTVLPLIQLIGDDDVQDTLVSQEGLDVIAQYANGIGPDKKRIEQNPQLVQWAHARKLLVHPYTFRKDQPGKGYENFEAELRQFYFTYDVDGLFTDHPDVAAKPLHAPLATSHP
ncbi:MAG: glycerophosphodiester phosphodiesterase [Candidatus Hydrogenedentes bacterium]|nr:glycerophosphodiester phosphodiesterase [Candidatus Hydrogenedentota bacterium]